MKDNPYVNVAMPRELKDAIKALAKKVPRRTMIAYLEKMVAEATAKEKETL